MPTNDNPRIATNSFLMAARIFLFAAVGLFCTGINETALAEDYTSPSFIIRAPVVSEGGSYSSSTSFQLQNSLGQVITGINSGLSFQQLAGFWYWGWPVPGASPTPTPTPSPSPSVPAPAPGGGGTVSVITTGVNFSGRAYPSNKVVILKDGQIVATTVAGPDSNFNVSLTGLSGGNYNFSVYGEDSQGRHSAFLTFPVLITSGATVTVSGIFIAPTIGVDKLEVRKGDDIAIFGQTAADANITLQVNSEEPFFAKAKSDKNGIYLYNFDTSVLVLGQHLAKAKSAFEEATSPYGSAAGFKVGTKNVSASAPAACAVKADLNNDCRVNLVDFSIAAFWYKRTISAEFKVKESERLNGDGKVDLTDFSIMAYYWTG